MLQREEHQTLKALEILSAKTSKKSAVEREDQEPYWNQKKKHYTCQDGQQAYYL